MAAPNIDPIFTRSADIQWTNIPSGTTANTALDGTGTVFSCFTADATNGGFVQAIRIKAPTTSTPTVIRFFLNNGSTNATASNNSLLDEMTLPTITGTNVASTPIYEIPVNRALPAGYKINACYGTSVTGAVYITTFGGKY